VAYHTRLVLAAERPVSLEIGRAAYVGRPVSVPVMLRALACFAEAAQARDPATLLDRLQTAEMLVLRAAFPAPPRWRWWQDPMRAIARLDHVQRTRLLTRLMAMPSGLLPPEVDPAPVDPYAELRRQQKALSSPATPADGHRPTLALAALACRARFGDAWYYNPARWGTSDGYVPHAVAWAEYEGLAALDASAQLLAVVAQGVLHAKNHLHLLATMKATAYPRDPLYSALTH
jgi:hypothetical protein